MRPLALFLLIVCTTAASAVAEETVQLTPRQALRARISEVKFEQVPLEQAIDWLRDVLATNIVVDWVALESVDIYRDAPVSVNLRWVRVNQLLGLLLRDAGGHDFAFYGSGNVLHITTREVADEPILTRSYPVEDLLLTPRRLERFDVNISTGSDGNTQSSIFSNNESSDDERERRKEAAEALIVAIMNMFPTETWRENGGRSHLTIFRGQLIVSAPRSIHELLGGREED